MSLPGTVVTGTPRPAGVDRIFSALGHTIAFEERGDGERACVMLHGLAGDRALLIDTLDAPLASAGLRRLYVDLPGHGASTGNPELASADALVESLRQLVVAVGGDVGGDAGGAPPLLVGYSYGAYLALGLLRDLATVGGALLLCPVVEPDLGKRHRPPRRVARRDPELAFATDDDNHERATFEEVAVVQSAEVLAAYRRLCMPASRATNRPFVDAVRDRYVMGRPLFDALGRTRQGTVPAAPASPISIICGRDDHWVGYEDAAHLLRNLPAASLHVLPDCGQLLPLEQPARLRLLVEDWLSRALAPSKEPAAQ